jgi:DNA invertase Pin-like site-specific DNA recombinase
MLTVLGGLAEYERHLILSRTAEGRTRAQANGVRFGRKPSLTPYQRAEALRRRAAGETLVEIAKLFGVSHMTIARLESQPRHKNPRYGLAPGPNHQRMRVDG